MTEAKKNPYNHPYTPYPIQVQFMNAIDELLTKNYKIGIFESPTGTGKTLSLICSAMSWLREQKKNNFGESGKLDDDDDDEPDWIKESYANIVQSEKDKAGELYEKHLEEVAQNAKNLRISKLKEKDRTKRFKKLTVEVANSELDDQFIPDDYHSDDEASQSKSTKINLEQRNELLDSEIQDLMKKFDKRGQDSSVVDDAKMQIIFASRTHSQLNQFSSQLRLPSFPSSFSNITEHLKYLPVGSRKQLCIHETVSKIKDATLMNEACLDLQNTDSKVKCQFYPSKRSEDLQERSVEFRDYVFSSIHDIEELPSIGEHLGVCPYYSIRKAVPVSEVITLPYQLLLQKSSREALGVSIKNSIIIIDEAHNLLDTITSIHSVSVGVDDFERCKESLKKYLSKFSRKMNGGNRIHLMKLVKIIDLILRYVSKTTKTLPGKPINVHDIFDGTTGDLLNIHRLEKYLTVSKIAFKIESYMEKSTFEDQQRHKVSKTPTLFRVVEFLKSMSSPSKEGKFFFDVKDTKPYLTYMLLDPSQVFKEIVEESKCVILAGGTMEPTSDYTDYLFPYVDTKAIKKFACGHIIPRDNLNVFTVPEGETKSFEFSFDKRNDSVMINELGKVILRLISKIPHGVVIFLPSYKYLSQIVENWKMSSLWDSINKIKKVFSESSTTDVLSDYSSEVSLGHGALLLSVVGGRLSEGINFSDDLARAVMVIGLPFPNAFSGEIISKKKYIEDQVMQKTKDRQLAQEATRSFYENLCMKAVNQSVGRSIRHINDYSTIYLIDRRYCTERIKSKLSQWIQQRLIKTNNLDDVVNETDHFFSSKIK